MTAKTAFRTHEVSRLTGLTRRQIDHWDRNGFFAPSMAQADGKGSLRYYSFLDVVQLRIVKKLLDAGLSTRQLRNCLKFLRENLQEGNLAGLSLVAHGKGLYMLTDDPSFAISLTEKGQVVWMTDIGIISHEITSLVSDDVTNRINEGLPGSSERVS